jgi:hypothetical protein
MSTPLTLEDRLEIRDLFAHYAWAYDCRDFAAVGETFVPDGVLIAEGRDRSEGRAAIAEGMRRHIDAHHLDKVMQHHIDHLLLEGDGSECRAYSYWMVPVRIIGGGCIVGSLGWYEDVLVKSAGRWFFKQRVFRSDMPKALPWKA